MPLQCNIDAKGKLVRLIYGTILLVAGLLMIGLWAARDGTLVAWIVSIACTLVGAFVIFESRTGWCVVRALGFKTPV
jgi:hypothetical protein